MNYKTDSGYEQLWPINDSYTKKQTISSQTINLFPGLQQDSTPDDVFNFISKNMSFYELFAEYETSDRLSLNTSSLIVNENNVYKVEVIGQYEVHIYMYNVTFNGIRVSPTGVEQLNNNGVGVTFADNKGTFYLCVDSSKNCSFLGVNSRGSFGIYLAMWNRVDNISLNIGGPGKIRFYKKLQ